MRARRRSDGLGPAHARAQGEGAFEPWPALAPTLMPLLRTRSARSSCPGRRPMPRRRGGRQELRHDARRHGVSQEPQKYHARSLAEIRRKYAAAKAAPGLEAILAESGCLAALAQARRSASAPERPSNTSMMRAEAVHRRPGRRASGRAGRRSGCRHRDRRPDKESAIEQTRSAGRDQSEQQDGSC